MNLSYYLTHLILPFLGFTFLALTAILILNRFLLNLREPNINAVKTKIDDFLTTIVFSSYDDVELASEIQKFKKEIPFKKNWCKKIVLNKIIFLKRNLKGDIIKTSHLIYEQFDLFKYSVSLLKSKKKYLNSLGMYHLKVLEYHKGKDYVTPFLNHKNRILNSSAYLTIISLEPENLGLLYNYQKPIFLAGEINIMNIVHQKKPPIPSNLKDWIHSTNPSIVRLGIKLMAFYNYTNENQSIVAHLKSEDEKIRFAAIRAIKQLFIFDTEKNLIDLFKTENMTNQLETLKTLAVIGNKDAEEFIHNLLKEPIDSDIKLRAVKSLSKMNSTYIENFIGNHEISKMIQHVKIPSI